MTGGGPRAAAGGARGEAPWAGAAYVLASAAGFGTLAILAKVAYGLGLNTPTILFHRFLFGSALLALALRARGPLDLPRGRALAVGALMGLVGYTGQSFLFFTSVRFVTASLAGLLLYTYPVFVTLLAALVLRERVTPRVAGALALATGGLVLLLSQGAGAPDARGVAAGVGAALVYSGYILAGRTALEGASPRGLTLVVMASAAASFLALGAASGQLRPVVAPREVAVVLAIAVAATVMPILTFFEGLRRLGPARASILSTVEPLVTVALGAALLGESLTLLQGVGAAVLLGAVALLMRSRAYRAGED